MAAISSVSSSSEADAAIKISINSATCACKISVCSLSVLMFDSAPYVVVSGATVTG